MMCFQSGWEWKCTQYKSTHWLTRSQSDSCHYFILSLNWICRCLGTQTSDDEIDSWAGWYGMEVCVSVCVCLRGEGGSWQRNRFWAIGSEWGQRSPRLQVWMKAGRDSATENPGSEVVATTLLLPVINSCFRGDAKICHVSKSHDGLLSDGGIGELEESLGELVGNAKAKTSLDRQLEVWALRGSRRGSGLWAVQELLYWLIHSDIHRSLLFPWQKKEKWITFTLSCRRFIIITSCFYILTRY